MIRNVGIDCADRIVVAIGGLLNDGVEVCREVRNYMPLGGWAGRLNSPLPAPDQSC